MLNTVIDYVIFEHFTRHQPKPIPDGSTEDNEYWNSFWKYLKEQSNILITGFNNQENIFLNQLITGRKGTKIAVKDKNFKKPYKGKFPNDTSPYSVFFLDENSEKAQNDYKKKNGFLFGFLNDYSKVFKDLSLFNKDNVLPVRKEAEKGFTSWERLNEYILPFTDLLIADNYMFDKSLWDFNLFKIIEQFANKTPVRFNLLLLTFADNTLVYKDCYEEIKTKLQNLNINCNLSIVYATQTLKEHDRGIFTNYLRIKSGDSFIYFDKNGSLIIKGTDIDFYSLAERDAFNASEAALKRFKHIINELKTHREKEKRLIGNMKLRLIDQIDSK